MVHATVTHTEALNAENRSASVRPTGSSA
jgi:hypothetical protein